MSQQEGEKGRTRGGSLGAVCCGELRTDIRVEAMQEQRERKESLLLWDSTGGLSPLLF